MSNDVVITWLLNNVPDTQRGTHIGTDPMVLADLANSVNAHGYPLIVLTDCITNGTLGGIHFVNVPPGGNPYWYRWTLTSTFLEATPGIDRCWAVDGTDVTMLHDAFEHMESGKLYSGSEPWPISGNALDWLRDTGRSAVPWLYENSHLTCLNVGIIGGDRADVLAITKALSEAQALGDQLEMGQYQKLTHTMYPDVVTGLPVHTEFRANDIHNPIAWWRHK